VALALAAGHGPRDRIAGECNGARHPPQRGRAITSAASSPLRRRTRSISPCRHAVRREAVSRQRRRVSIRDAVPSRWIFDVRSSSATFCSRCATAARGARIYELVLPAWHEVWGSKLRAWDFLWCFVEVLGVWRRRSLGAREPGSPGAREPGTGTKSA
jgi:hypothetical protein